MNMGLPSSFSILKQLIAFLVTLTIFGHTRGSVRRAERERLALLDFKKSFVSFYSNDKLSSWKSSEKDCCIWDGITCDNHTRYIVSLDLEGESLESNQLRPSLLQLRHLSSLDLRGNNFAMRIPEFIGSFSNLKYLDLSYAGFLGKIPPQLGNLSIIQTLNLGGGQLSSDSFHWLSRLSSLTDVDLSGNNFSEATDWLFAIRKLHLLASFQCEACSFPSLILPYTPHHVNFSTSLEMVDLSESNLSSSTIFWFLNNSSSISSLDLRDLNLEGPFPDIFQNMTSLNTLYLSGNQLPGGIFKSIGKNCNLKELQASQCGLNLSLSNVLQALTSCASSSLQSLDLNFNNLTGTIPPMLSFGLLTELNLDENNLDSFQLQNSTLLPRLHVSDNSSSEFSNGTIRNTLRLFPGSLETLGLYSNSLTGVLSDAHFTNFSNLANLELSNNPNLAISFSKPPLQAVTISLGSCKLGPTFPRWLLAQNSFSSLDISNSTISSSIPFSFWKNLPSSLSSLNLSHNNFHGRVPNLPFSFSPSSEVDLSSNAFCGTIPSSLFKASVLLLSKNNFSGFSPPPHSDKFLNFNDVHFIDFSDNSLSGTIPGWFWSLFRKSVALNLANNHLCGTIPKRIGNASAFQVLILSNNSFSGPLPLWLKSCSNLNILDLSWNRFSGLIPSSIGEELKNLVFLSLKSNNLTGTIPASICHLKSLQILDLSYNNLVGSIPSSVHKFTAMTCANSSKLGPVTSPFYDFYEVIGIESMNVDEYFDYLSFNWKGTDQKFRENLLLVKLIDLSNNNLSGEIPIGMTSLLGLISLDLSRNNLNGSIPEGIGQLKALEVLNLSYNWLSGPIPSTLSSISYLGYLNFSHNNLSGRIPTGTQLQGFNSSAYAENPGLCGLPLSTKCPGDVDIEVPQLFAIDGGDKWPDKQYFYAGLGTGFAFGFLMIIGTLTFIRKWRYAFYRSAGHFADWILVFVELSISRVSRIHRFK